MYSTEVALRTSARDSTAPPQVQTPLSSVELQRELGGETTPVFYGLSDMAEPS